mmetsp:Transcript_60363/g.171593  ORF Transcript_60363/g.171593 Transcript_60363/m.171593 type:complete len:85 (+) Transcript_60363:1255-1509(+)
MPPSAAADMATLGTTRGTIMGMVVKVTAMALMRAATAMARMRAATPTLADTATDDMCSAFPVLSQVGRAGFAESARCPVGSIFL